MWKRFKDALLPKRKEDDERERCLQERTERVQTFLYPVYANWGLVSDIVVWRTPILSTVGFLLISGVFWAFLLPSYQRCIIAIGVTLLFLAIQKETRNYVWNLLQEVLELQVKEENRFQRKPEELSRAIASTYTSIEDHIVFMRELRHRSSSKFYCLLAVYIFTLLATWAFVPIARVLYILCCCCYFYPSMCYYGLVDKIKQKMGKLTEPVATHWEHNLTKRQRNLVTTGSYDSESDDEFALEKSKYTRKILSAVIPDELSRSQNDLLSSTNDSLAGFDVPSLTSLGFHDDFTDDEDIRHSEFEHGLELPSLSQFDSLMEPYDEFHYGLQFPDANQSVSHGFTLSQQDVANYGDLTDDDVDDIPMEENTDFPARYSHQEGIDGVRQRRTKTERKEGSGKVEVDTTGRYRGKGADSPRGLEKDYEFLDHSELDDPGDVPVPQSSGKGGKYLGKVVSYSQSSIMQVSKWLGY